jgi:hypothetical protein
VPKTKPKGKYGATSSRCPGPNSILVSVLYWDNSLPVSGVDVSIAQTGASGKTDSKGLKEFKGLDDGSYDVSVDIGGLSKAYRVDQPEQSESVAGGEEGSWVVFLYRRCSIKVTVVGIDGGNPALARVGVNVASSGNRYDGTSVAGSGLAAFPDVKPGLYKAQLTLPETLNRYYVPAAVASDVIDVTKVTDAVKRIVLPLRPGPTLRVAAPEVILVKRDYQDVNPYKPHRLAIYPGKTGDFDGEGLLESNLPGSLYLYRAAEGGAGQALPARITNAELTSGQPLYLEARQPSAVGGPSVLTLSLVDGTIPVLPPVTANLTCVRVQLDLHAYKATTAQPDTAALSDADKIAVGRNLHLQDNRNYAGRALLVVRQAEPGDYAGELVLTPLNANVNAFPNEVVTGGEAAEGMPWRGANNLIPGAGNRYWLQGDTVSGGLRDSGFTLGLAVLPGVEGDRAHVTVVQVTLDVCDFRIPGNPDPLPIPAARKMGPGRFVHLQDGGNHHARAKVLVGAVAPAAFAGNLEVVVWDVTADNSANPRLRLYTAEAPGGAAEAQPCVIGAAATPAERWADGAIASLAAFDTELRLRVADAEGWADRAALTIGKFFVTEVFFDQTAADIYYARIPDPADVPTPSYLLADPADRNVPHKHFTPGEMRPIAGGWHWKKDAGDTIAPEYSWPAVFHRHGAAGAPVPGPTLFASFEIIPHIPGDIDLYLGAVSADVKTQLTLHQIQNGVAVNKGFYIDQIPNTVARLDGFQLQWFYPEFAHVTEHTLFFVDETPKPANNGYGNQYLWEVFEWSCHWADGQTGKSNVLVAIWDHFYPVKAPPVHDSGLIYWKNQHLGIKPKQNMEDGIRGKDDPPLSSGAVSCKVFDRMLINCVTAHGMDAAEVKIIVDNESAPATYTNNLGTIPAGLYADQAGRKTLFTDGNGRSVYATGWVDTTTDGQANTRSPAGWASHWIAAVDTDAGWMFMDASYGAPVEDCGGAPGPVNDTIDVDAYEQHTAASYMGAQVNIVGTTVTATGKVKDIPLTADPDELPCLIGIILWTSY